MAAQLIERQDNNSFGNYIIVWQQNDSPENCYYRPDDGLLACDIKKASKANGKWENRMVALNKIKKGDTLSITPVAGAKITTPVGIDANIRHSLFFKTQRTGWQHIPTK